MSYIQQLRKNISNTDNSRISGLRKAMSPDVEPEEKLDDQDLVEDIKALKADGYTLEEIHEAIDSLEEVKDKDTAKETARGIFEEGKDVNGEEARLIIIRHGTTNTNKDNRLRAWMDVPLSEEGKQEAENTGQALENKGVDIIFTADLTRAEQTAEIISKYTGAPVKKVIFLRPWHLGELTGNEVEPSLPVIKKYSEETPDKPIPGGESFNEFVNRFLNGVEKIKEDYPGKTVAVVTHHRGERLLAAWEGKDEKGHTIDLTKFLEKGVEPGEFRMEGEGIDSSKETAQTAVAS